MDSSLQSTRCLQSLSYNVLHGIQKSEKNMISFVMSFVNSVCGCKDVRNSLKVLAALPSGDAGAADLGCKSNWYSNDSIDGAVTNQLTSDCQHGSECRSASSGYRVDTDTREKSSCYGFTNTNIDTHWDRSTNDWHWHLSGGPWPLTLIHTEIGQPMIDIDTCSVAHDH